MNEKVLFEKREGDFINRKIVLLPDLNVQLNGTSNTLHKVQKKKIMTLK